MNIQSRSKEDIKIRMRLDLSKFTHKEPVDTNQEKQKVSDGCCRMIVNNIVNDETDAITDEIFLFTCWLSLRKNTNKINPPVRGTKIVVINRYLTINLSAPLIGQYHHSAHYGKH
jgi:hypothetical protein